MSGDQDTSCIKSRLFFSDGKENAMISCVDEVCKDSKGVPAQVPSDGYEKCLSHTFSGKSNQVFVPTGTCTSAFEDVYRRCTMMGKRDCADSIMLTRGRVAIASAVDFRRATGAQEMADGNLAQTDQCRPGEHTCAHFEDGSGAAGVCTAKGCIALDEGGKEHLEAHKDMDPIFDANVASLRGCKTFLTLADGTRVCRDTRTVYNVTDGLVSASSMPATANAKTFHCETKHVRGDGSTGKSLARCLYDAQSKRVAYEAASEMCIDAPIVEDPDGAPMTVCTQSF